MGRTRADSGNAGLNVIRLDGRILGACYACGRPVRFGDNFIRMRGAPVHLSCALTAARSMRDAGRN
jgi:hypothetical protein